MVRKFLKTKISVTFLPKIVMGSIVKKGKEKITFIYLCLLFREFHVRLVGNSLIDRLNIPGL